MKIIDLGRRFILAFRQTLVQKVQEHDSGELYKRYKSMEGEIISGEVHHVRHRELIIYDDQQNELILRREDMIPEKDFLPQGRHSPRRGEVGRGARCEAVHSLEPHLRRVHGQAV